jgi:penicillin amidase
LDEALAELRTTLGGEMKEWNWGRLHTITFKHLFGEIKVLKPIFNIGPYAVGGSGTTPNNGEFHFATPYTMFLGPSMRSIVDFADVNMSLSVLPTGQSGQPLHPNYSDQTLLWLNKQYRTVSLDEDRFSREAIHILNLYPITQ